MKYWEEMYGKRTKDFIEGVIAGVKAFAIWKDGEQFVGIQKQPLKEAIAEKQPLKEAIAEIKEQLG